MALGRSLNMKQSQGHCYSMTLLVITILLFSTVDCSAPEELKPLFMVKKGISTRERDQAKAGLEAGKQILDFIEKKDFTTALTNVAKNIGPYLGAIGPVIGFIVSFLPGQESAELQYLKQMMEHIDRRFDQVDSRLADIERLVHWSTTKIQFIDFEHNIHAMAAELELLYKVPPNGIENRKTIIINTYENTYDSSGLKLYQAVMKNDSSFQEDLGKAIMKYTKNDRKKVQVFLMSVMKLLLEAAKLDLAYLKIKDFQVNEKLMKDEWEERIKNAKNRFISIDNNVMAAFKNQSDLELAEYLRKWKSSSNKDFGMKLWHFLIEKYYWRDWFVVVYNPVAGWNKHRVRVCGGHTKFRIHGRNVIIASVPKSSAKINKKATKKMLDSVRVTKSVPYANGSYRSKWGFMGSGFTSVSRRADEIFYDIKSGACSVVVIRKDSDIWIYPAMSRYVDRQAGKYKMMVWG